MAQDDAAADGVAATPGRDAETARKLPGDPAAIEALIAQRRESLASTIDELAVRARPREIARRSAADIKGRARAFVMTQDGELRTERLAAVTGAVAAVLAVMVALRRRRRRSR
jgi:hypothetical protein